MYYYHQNQHYSLGSSGVPGWKRGKGQKGGGRLNVSTTETLSQCVQPWQVPKNQFQSYSSIVKPNATSGKGQAPSVSRPSAAMSMPPAASHHRPVQLPVPVVADRGVPMSMARRPESGADDMYIDQVVANFKKELQGQGRQSIQGGGPAVAETPVSGNDSWKRRRRRLILGDYHRWKKAEAAAAAEAAK